MVTAAFANTANGIFVFDDIADITANPSAQAATFFERLPVMNRPLTKASYALTDAVTGLSPAVFHLINAVLHGIAALVVFALVRHAFRALAYSETTASLSAFSVTAVWALHPALSETVSYVSGRSMGLSSLLILLMLLAVTTRASVQSAAAVFACALLAPLARETALIGPFILLWWQMTIARDTSWRERLSRWFLALAGCLIAATLIIISPRHSDLITHSLNRHPPLEALRGNVHAATESLRYWFTPAAVTIDPQPPLAWGWSDPRTILKIVLFAVMALTALLMRRRLPVAMFGLGLAMLALAPSNTFLWRADPVSLKPLYLSGLGLTLAIADILLALLRNTTWRMCLLGSALSLSGLFGVMTIQRNALFADEIALWKDAADKAPDYGRPWIMLGYALFNEGRYNEAVDVLKQGCDLDPLDENAAEVLLLAETLARQQNMKPR